MSKKNILLAITNGVWLIDNQSAISFGATVSKILSGSSLNDLDESPTEVNLLDRVLLFDSEALPYVAKDTSFSNANSGSVAVISMTGPVMKYDNCGDPGSKTYENLLRNAYSNPNISGVVLVIDSPGGEVSGTQSLASVIKERNKPVVTLAEDLMASAAYWFGSSADYVMAKNGTTRVGSIGTMSSFEDMRPFWESQGVKFHEIYADASVDKNAAFTEARAGNYDRYKKEVLNPLNEEFLSDIKSNRTGKIDTKKENVLTGKTYLAKEALTNGLIDEIGGLEKAVSKVFELAGEKASEQSQQNFKPNNMKKILVSMAAIAACLSAKGFEKPEELEALSDDHLKAINDSLTEASANKTKVDELTSQVATLQASISEKDNQIAELAKVNPGATTSKKEGDAESASTSNEEEELTSFDREKAELAKKGLI